MRKDIGSGADIKGSVPMQAKSDIYAEITATIIQHLENGTKPWVQPWAGCGPMLRPRRACGKPYNGINVVVLWSAAMRKGYASPTWMTFNQARELGGNVRKGEKGQPVVYFRTLVKETEGSNGETDQTVIPMAKKYTVFNVEQIDGLPSQYYRKPEAVAQLDPGTRIASVDAFISNLKADIRTGGHRAFYSPSTDHVQMPEYQAFKTPEDYYGTLGHEMVHWTKEEKRCNRDLGRKRWGDEGYAMEELCAEIGAAFLAADLGYYCPDREDHASYIAGWLKVLKDDKRAIFTAASYAQKAVEYLHAQQPGGVVADEAAEMDEAA